MPFRIYSIADALPASAFFRVSWPAIGVGFIEGMPVDAMSLPGMDGRRAFAPVNVLFLGNRFQMVWENAMSHTAKVVKCKPIGYGAYK